MVTMAWVEMMVLKLMG